MSWKRYFTPVTNGSASPLTKTSTTKPTRSNYSSYLPDVYSGHPNRLERYAQYDTMDLDPEVNAAFDILSEFCTQTNEENGTPFQIFFKEQATSTEVKIVKKYLQQWCKLNNFQTRIFKIVRNTFKYGDCFFVRDPETQSWFYVDPSKVDKIIVNESEGKKPEQYVIRDLNVNFENLTVTQINPSNQNTTPGGTTYVTGGVHQRGMVGAYPQSAGTRFSINQNQWAIDAEHVIHVSLSEGLDNNFPFGNSLMETIFKVYKQKELLEDAIIIYRVQRAPERRVFYIDVGNMPSHLAMSFVERVKNEVNQRRIPSLTGGGQSVIDSGFNPLAINEDYFFPQTCSALDTKIKLLDGRDLELQEIIQEYDQGKENWVYAINQNTHLIEPGKIVWAGKTRLNAQLVEVLLDNGEKIKVTPDHRFIMRDGREVEAQHLKEGDSVMPLYLHDATTGKHQQAGKYLRYTCNSTGKQKWVHTMVCPKKFPGRTTEIHHIDFNSLNNNPSNLIEMDTVEHRNLHKNAGTYHLSSAWKNPIKRAALIAGIKKYHSSVTDANRDMFRRRGKINGAATWANQESASKVRHALAKTRQAVSKKKTVIYSDEMCQRLCELYNQGYDSTTKLKILRTDEEFQKVFREANQNLLRDKNRPFILQVTDSNLNKMARYMGYAGWKDFKNSYVHNHRIISVTWLEAREDTGDITVESASGAHNFALTAGVFIHNSEGRGSKIDVLPGGCLAMDTIVPLLDGRKLSISELATEYQQGKFNWTFSTDPQTGKVVPGLISWAGVTQKSAKVMKLTFDNGQNLICTPDHKFPILGQDAVAAKDLKLGQRLIPFNSRNSNISPTKKRQYTEVYQNDIKEWKFVHREVVSFFENFDIIKEMVFDEKYLDSKKDTIHHVDHNRYNNNPENLVMMNFKDHQRYHAYYGFSSESQKKGTIAASKYFDSLRKDPVLWEKFIQEKRKTSKEQWENLSSTERLSRIKNITAGIISHFQNMSNSDRELLRQRNSEKSKLGISTHLLNLNDPNYYKEFVSSITNGWDSFRNTEEYFARNRKISKANAERMADLNYKERVFKNQRVKYSKDLLNQLQSAMLQSSSTWSIDQAVNYINEDSELLSLHLEINKDTVCANWNNDKINRTQLIGLVKFFGYQNWKHFKNDIKCYNHEIISIEFLDEPIEVGTLTIDQQEIYHNHHNFALDIGIFTNNSNLGEIDDLLFFTQKMMRALRIPSSYLPTGVDDSQAIFSDGKVGTAYIQELRFNNYCMRLQNLMREKFDEEFKRYLVKKGMNIDLNLFDIKFNPPQNFASYRQAEMDTSRINSFGSISSVPYLSKRFALKRYLGLSAEEIAENEKLWQEENGESRLTTTQNDMRDMGITPGGLSTDLSQLGQSDLGPENMEPNIDAGVEAAQPAQPTTPLGPTSTPPAVV